MKKTENFSKKGAFTWASTYSVLTLFASTVDAGFLSPFYAIWKYIHREMNPLQLGHPGPVPMPMLLDYLRPQAVGGATAIGLSLIVLWLSSELNIEGWKVMGLSMAVWPAMILIPFLTTTATLYLGVFFMMGFVFATSFGLSTVMLKLLNY